MPSNAAWFATAEPERDQLLDELVLAVDAQLTVTFANESAAGLLAQLATANHHEDLDRFRAGLVSRPVRVSVPDKAFTDLLDEAVRSRQAVSRPLEFAAISDRVYHAVVTPIRGPRSVCEGAVCVLHDQTALRRLERIRSDFVANVSHELRTPLTAVHGFIETLQHGSYRDPERVKKYLDIMHQETTRLISVINVRAPLTSLRPGRCPGASSRGPTGACR